MDYICEIRTDYVDPTKTEEILQECARIISEGLKNATKQKGSENSGQNNHS